MVWARGIEDPGALTSGRIRPTFLRLRMDLKSTIRIILVQTSSPGSASSSAPRLILRQTYEASRRITSTNGWNTAILQREQPLWPNYVPKEAIRSPFRFDSGGWETKVGDVAEI